MSTTRAAVVRTPGGPDAIEIIDVPRVEPGRGQLRIEVAAAAVNPVDLAVAAGHFHGLGLVRERPHVGLGWDVAGVVTAAGPGVDIPVGSRVAGLVDGFDRDYGTYAEELVIPAINTALVPDELDLIEAAAVPLNALTAAQMVDLLGDGRGQQLLVTGAAGALGANVLVLAKDRGWHTTGLARVTDELFVRSLGAEFLSDVAGRWDAVADCAALQEHAISLTRDGGRYVGVLPSAVPAEQRGVTALAVMGHPDGARLARLLDATTSGHLPIRVHDVAPLDQVADVHRAVAKGGIRGKYLLRP